MLAKFWYNTYNFTSRSVAQSGSASGLGPEGREFESRRSDHFYLPAEICP